MNRLFSFSFVAGLLLTQSFAEELPASKTAPIPQFPRPSYFMPQKIARDPFAPIQYGVVIDKKLPLLIAKEGSKGERGLADFFDLSTISLGRLSIAVINKRAFAEGEYFHFKQPDNVPITVRVVQIRDGEVELEASGQRVKLPLARKDPKSPLQDKEEPQ